jgi:hypothetical protein
MLHMSLLQHLQQQRNHWAQLTGVESALEFESRDSRRGCDFVRHGADIGKAARQSITHG